MFGVNIYISILWILCCDLDYKIVSIEFVSSKSKCQKTIQFIVSLKTEKKREIQTFQKKSEWKIKPLSNFTAEDISHSFIPFSIYSKGEENIVTPSPGRS